MLLPDHLKLTPQQEKQLEEIQKKAKIRHEQNRRKAKRQGRQHFPALPYECSAAFVSQFQS